MAHLNHLVKFFVDLAKIQAIANRRFDNSLGGLGFNEFIILVHLSQAEGEKMRRTDLAEKIGLTASGVTRILLPMEKVGLIKREVNRDDARSSLVLLASGGKRRLAESLGRAALLADDIIPAEKRAAFKGVANFLTELGENIR